MKEKTPFSHEVVCFQMLDFEISNSKSEVSFQPRFGYIDLKRKTKKRWPHHDEGIKPVPNTLISHDLLYWCLLWLTNTISALDKHVHINCI